MSSKCWISTTHPITPHLTVLWTTATGCLLHILREKDSWWFQSKEQGRKRWVCQPTQASLSITQTIHNWELRSPWESGTVRGYPASVWVGTGTETPVQDRNHQGNWTGWLAPGYYLDRTETCNFWLGWNRTAVPFRGSNSFGSNSIFEFLTCHDMDYT